VLSVAFELGASGCSAFDPTTRSSCLLHLSLKYEARHVWMMARVLSTLSGIFISLPPLLFPRSTTKSFTVRQAMHLNLSSSLGTRTLESQQKQRRGFLLSSSSSPGPNCFFFPLITRPGGRGRAANGWSSTGTSASSTSPSPSATVPRFPVLLLRPNSFGNGFEAVRLCDALLGDGRVGEPGAASGARGSGLLLLLLLLLEIGLLLPR